ncbi:haloacid dehalogenase type II [Litorivicinus sp.]|nr:haloacid dehalogenase type II [Litorivicinus sp.]MDC1208271.1 haloacid dehalogenase type II [Litorivicinus sp.]MDC1239604.1 haloacid dehalogenase type II [Litorivicinus sp.]MDC1466826.1 haloacid dehalogenase type II [Litorivicinus sp.]
MTNQVLELSQFRAFVFDAYGTLFDVNAAAEKLANDLGPLWPDLSNLWRQKQLEYSWVCSLMQSPWRSFWQVTQDALDYALEFHQLDSDKWRGPLLKIYLSLPAFAEVPAALSTLRSVRESADFAILSNGSSDMLNSAIQGSEFNQFFDAVLSADAVGVFKTSPQTYQMVIDRFLITDPSKVLFFSSNGWDIAGAGQFGFTTVWLNRGAAIRDRLPIKPDFEVPSLTDFLRGNGH